MQSTLRSWERGCLHGDNGSKDAKWLSPQVWECTYYRSCFGPIDRPCYLTMATMATREFTVLAKALDIPLIQDFHLTFPKVNHIPHFRPSYQVDVLIWWSAQRGTRFMSHYFWNKHISSKCEIPVTFNVFFPQWITGYFYEIGLILKKNTQEIVHPHK